MKYYSELVKKNFDSEQECLDAEKKYEEEHAKELALKEERAQAAKKVEEAFKDASETYKLAQEKLNEFVKKYGAFHKTWTSETPTSKSLFDLFFNEFWF